MAMPSSGRDNPSSRIVPEVGGARPISILIVVVLPAPLGPRKPKKQPRGTLKVRPSTAAFSSYSFRRSWTSIAGERSAGERSDTGYARFRTFATTFLSCSIFFCRSMMA